MVVGWRQFDSVSSNFRQAGYGYTGDGGSTWTFPGVFDSGVGGLTVLLTNHAMPRQPIEAERVRIELSEAPAPRSVWADKRRTTSLKTRP